MDPSQKRAARVVDDLYEQWASQAEMTAGMDPMTVRRLSKLVLETRVDVFRRALTDDPAGDVESPTIKLKLYAPREHDEQSAMQNHPRNIPQ